MALDSVDRQTLEGLPRLPDLHASYDVEVNALSIDQLFQLYERAGFLYPEKASRLLPYLDRVKENWRRMLAGREFLLYVLTAGDEKKGRASIAVWRTARHGWNSQHLVSENNPLASRAVILAGSAASILRGVDESHQNWFRPENRFPARVFGTMNQSIGDMYSSVQRHLYFALPRTLQLPTEGKIRIVPYNNGHKRALNAVASAARGKVFVTAEELEVDVELRGIDELYRNVGLRRYRQVWMAYREGKDEPIGAALAYRGPLGVNFSFIENRCDLLIHPSLPAASVPEVAASLLNAAAVAYGDFELDAIPVIADQIAANALTQLGATLLRQYCQGIWLKDGQLRFYRHVDQFYGRLLTRASRRLAIQPSLLG